MPVHGDDTATVAQTRLAPPRVRPECIRRPRLAGRLVEPESTTVVITGPAGSGKSTVMAQACAVSADGAWLSIQPADNDPARLWAALTSTLASAVRGFDPTFLGQLNALQPPSVDNVVAAVVNELATHNAPVRLFIDDVHLLTDPDCLRSLESFLQLRPPTVAVVLGGRAAPPFALRRHELDGRFVEIGHDELTMTVDEAREMLDAVGVDVSGDDLGRLHDRVEGWVAGLRWAAMAMQEGQDVTEFVGSATSLQSDIGRYLVEELLDRTPEDQRQFILETSILGDMCAGLCDAVRDRDDSSRQIEDLERWGAMVVSTDHGDGWYRYHHLVREVIAARLARELPHVLPDLHRRAAEWLRRHGEIPDAVDHALAAGDRIEAADMVCASWWSLLNQGQLATVIRIIERFDPSEVRAYQPLATAAAFAYGVAGEVERATSYYTFALEGDYDGPPPDGSASMESALAIMRAGLMFEGVGQALGDAELAHGLEPPGSPWRPITAQLLGLAHTWSGDPDRALPYFEEVTTAGSDDEALVVYALAEIALVRSARGEHARARSTAEQACERATRAGLEPIIVSAIPRAAAALSSLALGDPYAAAEHLDAARTPMANAGPSLPLDAMRAQLLLADVALHLGSLEVAAAYIDGAAQIDASIADTGVLGERLEPLRDRLDRARADALLDVELTEREGEVLAQLATTRTSREIGEALFLSRNTVRTYQQRLYKKLGVATREDAVAAARRAGLLSGTAPNGRVHPG